MKIFIKSEKIPSMQISSQIYKTCDLTNFPSLDIFFVQSQFSLA